MIRNKDTGKWGLMGKGVWRMGRDGETRYCIIVVRGELAKVVVCMFSDAKQIHVYQYWFINIIQDK